MQLFYDPTLEAGLYPLREREAAHAFRVLRRRVGDHLDLVDGRGGWYTGKVKSISKRECLLEVVKTRQDVTRNYGVQLLVAPTKNIDRFEWILEKATEIGVDSIHPFVSEHSERKTIRPDRLERILEAAMKQSLRAWKPELAELAPFDRALHAAAGAEAKFMAYLGDRGSPLLHRVAPARQRVAIAIGPEGGFTSSEADLAGDQGYRHVSLGPNRLRTETAAIVALHTLNQLNWSTL